MANDTILFNLLIIAKESLAECFQIFTDPFRMLNEPAKRYQNPTINMRHPVVKVYTDGTCFNNGKQNAQSRSGVWFGPNDERNRAIVLPQFGSVQLGPAW